MLCLCPLVLDGEVANVPNTEDRESDLPRVEIWEPSTSTSLPSRQHVTGHQLVVLLSLVAVAAVGILLMSPQLPGSLGDPLRTLKVNKTQ